MFRIGIDIDGVLYPWADSANEVMVEHWGYEDPGPHTTWDHLQQFTQPDHYVWAWSDEGMRVIFGKKKKYPNVEVFATLLNNPQNECHFVTHRNPAVLGAITADYLGWLFPDSKWEGLHVCKKTDKTKILHWDYFIDDKPETAEAMVIKGVQTYVPRRPWNRELEDNMGGHQYLMFYDDPGEVLEDIYG
ncbi:MAG: hypothetical protein KGL39_46560 [Patescibacteria group bacterium]|nr:hypothetical protein [Patescibacteria group bacterium]